MNTRILVFLSSLIIPLLGYSEDSSCSSTPTPTPMATPDGPTAPDPAFLNNDPRPETIKLRNSPALEIKQSGISPADQQAWRELSVRMEKNPRQSYELVMEVWRQNRPSEFQKLAIIKARKLVQSTDEGADLDFMLICLETPQVQREECLRKGRGNGLEKDTAAHRLSILEANPRLRLNLN